MHESSGDEHACAEMAHDEEKCRWDSQFGELDDNERKGAGGAGYGEDDEDGADVKVEIVVLDCVGGFTGGSSC